MYFKKYVDNHDLDKELDIFQKRGVVKAVSSAGKVDFIPPS